MFAGSLFTALCLTKRLNPSLESVELSATFAHLAKEIVVTMHLNIAVKMENGRKPWAPPALDSAYLENKFQPELNVASLGSRLGQRHRNKIGSEADSARSRIDIWCLEIGMVEDVKELRPEL